MNTKIGVLGCFLGAIGAAGSAIERFMDRDWTWATIASLSFLIIVGVGVRLFRIRTT